MKSPIRLTLATALLALLGACASVPRAPVVTAPTALHVDLYEVVSIEYASPTEIAGVSAYGPTDKAVACERAAAADVVQGDQTPGGHKYIATCLHIAVNGAAPNGQVVMQPFAGQPLEYLAIAVGLRPDGSMLGVKPLRGLPDAATCHAFAGAALHGIYADHALPKGTTLLIYCLGAPILDSAHLQGESVARPVIPWAGTGARCFWESDLSAPCEHTTLLRVSYTR